MFFKGAIFWHHQLVSSAQDGLSQRVARMRAEAANACLELHVIASAAKQSILPLRGKMDCFAALAMTARVSRGSTHPTNLVICPSGCFLTGLSSPFFGFSEKYFFPPDPNQI